MRVLGICRFSYPAVGGFKRMHDSVAERESYLYAPERMELRFRHFEALTLPSIKAQKDPDFTFLVMIGESLPQPHRDRLRDITADIPQVRIVAKAPMKHRLAMQLAIKEELGEDSEDSIQFRLDDDDAVGINFVRSLRWSARHTERMRTRWKNMALEYSNGYSVQLSAEGIAAEEVQSQLWACGLAVLFRAGDRRTVMNFAHHKLHTQMPTLINPHPHMYLRAKHDDNDSAAAFKTGVLAPIDAKTASYFKSRFNVDEAEVKRLFAAPVSPRGKR